MFNDYCCSYLINLKEDTKRKELFFKEWKNRSEIKIIEAIDTRNNKWENYKNQMSEKAIEDLEETIKTKKRKTHESLCPGAVGCYLSHLQCWEDFEKQEKGNYCFIFEDDSTIPEDLLEKVKNILSKLTTKWGFINLGASYISEKEFNEDLIILDRFLLTHAYVLSKYGAIILLKKHKKIEKQVDWFVSDNHKELITFGTKEKLCNQENHFGKTNIQTYRIK